MALTNPEEQLVNYIHFRADGMDMDAEAADQELSAAEGYPASSAEGTVLRTWAESWRELAREFRKWREDPAALPTFEI